MIEAGLKFRTIFAKEAVFSIKSVEKEKILDINSNMVAYVVDNDGYHMCTYYLTEIEKYFKTGEWIVYEDR